MFGETLARVGEDCFYRCFPELYSRKHFDTSIQFFFLVAPNEYAVNVERMYSRLFAEPTDAEFSLAIHRRQSTWNSERRRQLLASIDKLIVEISERTRLPTIRIG